MKLYNILNRKMKVFKEIFKEVFESHYEADKFLGAIKGEHFRELEESISFKGGDNLGKGKSKRPYIAFREENGFLRVFFLTTLFTGTVSINIREKCFIIEESEECKRLQEVCFPYRYAYRVRESTMKRVSKICGKCIDLEELNDIPLGGGES